MSKRFQWKLYTLIALGCFVFFWLGDALIDCLFFGKSFLQEILSDDPRELYMRTFSSFLLALFFFGVEFLGERRRRAEMATRQSDQLSHLFLHSTNDAVCIIDPMGLKITGANRVFLDRHSLGKSDIVGQTLPDFARKWRLSPEIAPQVAETAAEGTSLTREISYAGKGGELRYEKVLTLPVSDEDNAIERVFLVLRDITLRKNSDALLRESEARYRAIFDHTGTAMAIILPDGTLHMVNRGFEEMTGFDRQELEGIKRWTDFLSTGKEHPHLAAETAAESQTGGPRRSFELQAVDRHGTIRTMAGNWSTIAGSDKAVLSLVDISKQKEVEHALRESQDTLALAQRIARLGNWEWDVTTDTITWSDELYHMFGLDPAGTPPTFERFLQITHPEDRELVIRSVNDALYNGKPYHVDYRVVLPGGAVGTHTARAEVTYDAGGNPVRMIGTNQDITWRTEAEQALRVSEDKFSKAFRASPDSIVITRAQDGMYIDVNRAFQEITGYSREEVLGKTSMELGLWSDPSARMVMLKLLNQFGHVRNLDVKFKIKSGEIREVLWSAEVIEYGGEACLIAISRDVTDQRHLEKELLESDARLYMKHEELKNLFYQMEGIRREWEQTMDCISDMFILADQWGKIRRFNRAVETFTGKAHRDIVGRDWLTLLKEHGLKAHLEAPGVELPHQATGNRYILNRYPLPGDEIDGSTREVIIINDTTRIRLRAPSHLRLAGQEPH